MSNLSFSKSLLDAAAKVGAPVAELINESSDAIAENISNTPADKEPIIMTLPDGKRKAVWRKRSDKSIVGEAITDDDELAEEYNTKPEAEAALSRHQKKFPSKKLSVITGKSGKHHVVQHTSGGMSRIEEEADKDEKDRNVAAGVTTPKPKYVSKRFTNSTQRGSTSHRQRQSWVNSRGFEVED